MKNRHPCSAVINGVVTATVGELIFCQTNVHAPSLFSMVIPFQNCFCFLSSHIISGGGKKKLGAIGISMGNGS